MPKYEQYKGESKKDSQKRIAQNKKGDASTLHYKIGDAVDKSYQQRLQWLGLYGGEIDGAYGELSEKAHSSYNDFKKKGWSDKQIFMHKKGGVEELLIDSMKKGN